MFKDQVKIKISSGRGGDGVVRIDENNRPSGGNGGDGGNLYIQGTEKIYDLGRYMRNNVYRAENGEPGGRNHQIGSVGEDLVLLVPLATVVYDSQGNKLAEVDSHNQKELLFEGGRGGLGNGYYKGKGFDKREESTRGKKGTSKEVILELELQSDIIFIGLPNAGKSSLLRELTNADAKVAHYAFTTIDPQLGRMDGITLMDLPGLIEGTSEGKGVGTKFLKHTRRTNMVAHFISAESEDVLADYNLIRTELEQIDSSLANTPEIIVITKSDAVDKETLEDLKKKFKGKKVVEVNIFDDELLDGLREVFKEECERVVEGDSG